MKRGFTLIEIIITLGLIAVVLSMVTNLGQGFSDKIRFENTKEELTATIRNVIQDAATTNVVGRGTGAQKYGFISLSLVSGSVIQWSYSSGALSEPLEYSVVIPRGNIVTTGYSIVLTPYAIGCDTSAGGDFTLVSADDIDIKACYSTDAATCKLREISCNP